MRSKRAVPVLSLGKVLSVAGALLATNCSTQRDRPGLMVILTSNMSVPADLDGIQVQVLRSNQVRFTQDFKLRGGALGAAGGTSLPLGTYTLPTTLAVVGSSPGPVIIRVIGRRGGEPRTLREAITELPTDRLASLVMPIERECVGQLSAKEDGSVVTKCDPEETCSAGYCVAAHVDSSKLPNYAPSLVESADIAGKAQAGASGTVGTSGALSTSAANDLKVSSGGAGGTGNLVIPGAGMGGAPVSNGTVLSKALAGGAGAPTTRGTNTTKGGSASSVAKGGSANGGSTTRGGTSSIAAAGGTRTLTTGGAATGGTRPIATGGAATGGVQFDTSGCPIGLGPTMVKLPNGLCIDRTEVTRGQYQQWLSSNPKVRTEAPCSWNSSYVPDATCMADATVFKTSGFETHPAVCIDWCDARDYCKSNGKQLCGKNGDGFPSNYGLFADLVGNQWYYACSGAGTSVEPYTSRFSQCNGEEYWSEVVKSPDETTIPVGTLVECHPKMPANGAAFGQIFDMAGNVSEWLNWCEDNPANSDDEDLCCLGGGHYDRGKDLLRCANEKDSTSAAYCKFRKTVVPTFGFRCCYQTGP